MELVTELQPEEITPQAAEQIISLVQQLTTRQYPLDATRMHAIVTQPDVHVFVARDNGAIVGMVTAVVAQLFDKKMLYLEDMIVGETARGKGLGRKLVDTAIAFAKSNAVSEIVLTSNPSRTAAIQLYEMVGFTKYDTNFYRLKL